MFDGISFTRIQTTKPLSSRQVTEKFLRQQERYDLENLSNSEFHISGSMDAFLRPPLSAFAEERLFYMQSFSIFHYKAGSFTRRQNFHSFQILYTYSGTGVLDYEKKRYELTPETGILLDCRKLHEYRALEDWDVAVLHFQGPLAERYDQEYARMGQLMFREPVSGSFHRRLERLLTVYSGADLHRELEASHCLEGMLLHLLQNDRDAVRAQSDTPMAVQKVMRYLAEHYAEAISLDRLEELTRTNKFHLSKEFKRYTGFSPYEYLIRLRIEQAKILLKTTDLPAVKIAHEVGIHDANNFNYLFKNRVGMTPIRFRNHATIL